MWDACDGVMIVPVREGRREGGGEGGRRGQPCDSDRPGRPRPGSPR